MIRLLALACVAALPSGRVLVGPQGATGVTGAQGSAGASGASNNAVGQSCAPPLFLTGVSGPTASCGVTVTVPDTRRFLTVGASDFTPRTVPNSPPWTASEETLSRTSGSQALEMIASLHLPEGARMKQIRCWFQDGVAGNDPNAGEAIRVTWAVHGAIATGAPGRARCIGTTFASVDNASAPLVIADTDAFLAEPACTLPVQSALGTLGPTGYRQHTIELFTSGTTAALVFRGCDVAFDVSEALP